MSSHGAVAVAGCSESNHVAKKRRRWSTAQQDAALAPNRFAAKKQLKILGRHHPSSNSLNSLASFQSNSNPIFEPSEEPSYSSNNNHKPEAEFVWYNNPSSVATLATPLDDLSRVGRAGVESRPHPHPKPKSRLGKVSPEPPQSSNQADVGEWGIEQEDSAIIGDPIQLLHSPAIKGKSRRVGYGLLDLRDTSMSDNGEGEWPVREEIPNERDDRLLVLTSSEDGAQSIEGPSLCLIDGGAQQEEMLSCVEACEKRSRELVANVQANAAADLAQLRTYEAIIERLRVDCTTHEAAGKRWSDMHRDTEAQLVSAQAEITELERQRGLQAIAIGDFKQKLGIEKDLQDAMVISDKWRLETLEQEHDGLRQKVKSLETALMAAKSELSAAAQREVKWEAEAALQRDLATQGVVEKKEEEELEGGAQVGADNEGEIEDISNETLLQCTRGGALLAQKLIEAELQLGDASEQVEKLQTERDELRITVQDAEKRVEEFQKERDAVVVAVQQEWDAVKVALRQDKEKLERELELVRAQNSKLQNDLDTKNKIMNEDKRPESKDLEAGCESSLQVLIGDKVIEPGTERGDSLIALWKEYQKLEVELSEAFDHNKKQKSNREELNGALIGVREGNKKLHGELSDLQVEKTKLERERDALMTAVQEERQKLEDERAVVCKAMRGENEKLESEREVLLTMQDYLQKLQIKKDQAQTLVGGDEKRRRKGKRGAATQN